MCTIYCVKRLPFNQLVGVSYLLFWATAVLWARSYFIEDAFAMRGRGKSLPYQYTTLISRYGELTCDQKETKRITAWPPSTGYFRSWEGIKDVSEPFTGVVPRVSEWDVGVIKGSFSATRRYVSVSYVFLSALWAILPLICIWRSLVQKRKHRLGICRTCGYDLRATPDRCPECGTVPEMVVVKS